MGYSPWGHKESDTTEHFTFSYIVFKESDQFSFLNIVPLRIQNLDFSRCIFSRFSTVNNFVIRKKVWCHPVLLKGNRTFSNMQTNRLICAWSMSSKTMLDVPLLPLASLSLCDLSQSGVEPMLAAVEVQSLNHRSPGKSRC